MRWAAWLAGALALCAGAAQAHTRSETLSVWEVDGPDVRVTVTVPEVEALRLSAPGSPPDDSQVAGYLAQHLGARAGSTACAAAGAPVTPPATKGFRRVELRWRCAGGPATEIHSNAFFELVPTHLTYARVRQGDAAHEQFSEQLLTTEHRTLELGGGEDVLASAGFARYVGLGVLHILTGPDHIAFLLGLVLLSARFRDLALVVTGFTLGHSATLALAVTGWLRPQPELIDVLIALTIGLVGAENTAQAARRPRLVAGATGALLLAMAAVHLTGVGKLPTSVLLGAALFAPCYLVLTARLAERGGAAAARVRAVVTAAFGLIHGFAFANDLIEMRLPPGRLAELLFGFNLGVEAGQLVIVAALLGTAALLARARLALPRAPVVEAGSAALVGLSLFWIVGRTYG